MFPVKNKYLIRGSSNTIERTFSEDLGKYTHMCVLTCSIPKTYYTLPQQATLILDGVQLDFRAGNYNVNSFRLALQTALNSTAYTYIVSFPNSRTEVDTGHYTMSVSDNSGVQPSFITSDTYLAQMLGIDTTTEYSFASDSFESVNVVNFQSYDEIVIKCDAVDSQEQNLQEVYSSGTLYNTSIEWECKDINLSSVRLKSNLGNKQSIKFILVDSNGELLNLNGNDWSIMILLYKENDIITPLRKFMRYNILRDTIQHDDVMD